MWTRSLPARSGASASPDTAGPGFRPSDDPFADLRLQPGIDLVMAEARLHNGLGAADLVLTGEGGSTPRPRWATRAVD